MVNKKIYKASSLILIFLMMIITFFWIATASARLSSGSLSFYAFAAVIIAIISFSSNVRKAITRIIDNRLICYLVAICFQLLLLISSELMIRSDAAFIFNSARVGDERIIGYLNVYSNNAAIYAYERFFIVLFGARIAIWIMQLLNIFYINVAIYILDISLKKYLSKEISDIVFALYLVLLGLTPQYLAMYTDAIILPFLSLQIYQIFSILKLEEVNNKNLIKKFIFLSVVTAIGMLFRPTCMVIAIAFIIVYVLNKEIKTSILNIVCFLIIIVAITKIGHFAMNKTIGINPPEGEGITMLAYVDLGLTYSGADQVDFREGLNRYIKDEVGWETFSNNVVISDIKRRLNEYGIKGFIDHILYKESLTTSDGTLGWTYTNAGNEVDYFVNPIYEKIQDIMIFNYIRGLFINIEDSRYVNYRTWLQMAFVFMIVGCLLGFLKLSKYEHRIEYDFLSLACFGGILFLLIFEGGKSRYLIQFIPQFFIISAYGWSRNR